MNLYKDATERIEEQEEGSMVKLVADRDEARIWEMDDQDIKMDIGAWLAATGKQLGDLATLVGISKSTLYNRYKHPGDFSLDEVRRLYRVMNKILKARRCA